MAFGDQDYVDVARVLENYYSVSITGCGTGLMHSAMAGVHPLPMSQVNPPAGPVTDLT